jgi:hypothetical protein
MSQLTNIQVVSAYGRLLEFSANKRFGVLNNKFTDSKTDILALEFNNQIKKTSDLDIVELEGVEEIKRYEQEVDKRLSDFTYKNIIFKTASDREKVFIHSHPLAKEIFLQTKIDVEDSLKAELRKFPLTIPELISIAKIPHTIKVVDYGENDGARSVFLTSESTFKGKKRIILLVLYYSPDKGKVPNTHIWKIASIGLFSKDEYFQFIDNPIELFFKLIDKYGMEIYVGEKHGVYVFSEKVPIPPFDKINLMGDKGSVVRYPQEKGGSLVMYFMWTPLSVTVKGAFYMDTQKHLKDSLTNQI